MFVDWSIQLESHEKNWRLSADFIFLRKLFGYWQLCWKKAQLIRTQADVVNVFRDKKCRENAWRRWLLYMAFKRRWESNVNEAVARVVKRRAARALFQWRAMSQKTFHLRLELIYSILLILLHSFFFFSSIVSSLL